MCPWKNFERERLADREVQCYKTVAVVWFLIAVINFHLGLSRCTNAGEKKKGIGQIPFAVVPQTTLASDLPPATVGF